MPRKAKFPLKPDNAIIRTINYQIIRAADTIKWNQSLIKEAMGRYTKNGEYKINLTSYEDPNHNRNWHDHDTRELERIRDLSQEILNLEAEIGRLTRTKLALFGDCDFHGGEEILKELMSS